MTERLKDIPSPAPNESSQSNARPRTHTSDHATPLHKQLPLEIFGAIIHLCVGFTTPVRDLVTLQLVCRSWHDIIADTSFLWGAINAAEGLPAVRKALQMAKDSLVDLNCIEASREVDLDFLGRSSEIDQNEFFKLARGKINQWRSFVVESRQWESALDDLKNEKPPSLDTLHVVKKNYVPWGKKEVVIFGGVPAPGLKDVRFANVPINLASLHLSGLKSLRLEGIPSISAAEVITLLTESPGLEILHLVSLEGLILPTHPTPGQPNLASSSPIELAFLIELNLFSLHISFLSYLISTVAFPQLRSLRVGCELDEHPLAVFRLGETLGLNRLNPSMNLIASGARTYKVTLSSWGYYEICIGGLNINVSYPAELSMDHFSETFNWLSGHLDQSLRDLPLHLYLENCEPETEYLELFTILTNVTTLTLYSDPFYGPALEEIIPILGRSTSPPSPPIWLLPDVEVLHTNLVGTEGNLNIVDMVEARHTASRGLSAASLYGAFPKRFREIWLANGGKDYPGPPPNAEFMSQVVRVADGADVYWEGKKWIVS